MGQLRVVNYNIAQLNGDLTSLQDVFDALAIDDQPGFSTPVSVYVFQEVQSGDVAVLDTMLGAGYTQATYTNDGEDGTAGAQAMFYRDAILTEDVASHIDLSTGAGRQTDRWRLTLDGYDSPDASFYIYGSHLKAGSQPSDESTRFNGVATIRSNASGLPAASHIIYTGDMNFSANTEQGYIAFVSVAPTPGQAFDPLSPASWAGSGNAYKHTQAPCEFNCGLVGGGMDDRFDFQLISDAFQDGTGLSIIPGTYRAFGNDGAHYNNAINVGNNTYYPLDLGRSNALADDLFDASDHIPVVVDYQIPAEMTATVSTSDFGRVIVGAAMDIELTVTNVAFVSASIGADELFYDAFGSDGITGFDTDTLAALMPPNVHVLPVDTSTAAVISGTVTADARGPGNAVQNDLIVHDVDGTVLRPSDPSFDPGGDVDVLLIEQNHEADSGVATVDVAVHNDGFDALQSLLDVDSVGTIDPPFGFVGGLASGVGAGSATLTFSFDTAGLAENDYVAVVTIATSDEDVPGETGDSIELTLSFTIGGGAVCLGDLDDSGAVDVVDLLDLLAAWGPCPPPCDADLDDNGAVDVVDLLELLGAWGGCS